MKKNPLFQLKLKSFLIPLTIVLVIALVVFLEGNHRKAETDYHNLGLKQMQNQEVEAAMKSFQKALDQSPGNALARFGMGWALHTRFRYKDANEHYAIAFESLKKTLELTAYNQANIYQELKDYPKALEKFQFVAHLNPNSVRAHYNLGLIQEKLQQWHEAKNSYSRALELDPGFTEARTQLEKLQ